jgi:immune inhibitor A
MNQRTLLIIGIVLLVAVIACVACVALGGFGALWFLSEEPGLLSTLSEFSPPTESSSADPTPADFQSGEMPSDETLLVLENTIVPDNDPEDLAGRLKGVENIPDTVPFPGEYNIGDRRSFWVTNNDTNENFQTDAVLRYEGPVAYFWVEEGVSYDEGDLVALAQEFENDIVPTDREFFGQEFFPGIDNDPHIYVLYTTGIGFNVAGYFSSNDGIHPLANEFSNAAEMFVFNADNSPLDDVYTYGVLAHEMQHMIHASRDANETSWINEGMSELASSLNGYGACDFGSEYLIDPDLQLNDWPNDDTATTPHYGAGCLFVTYFLERFGNEATQALVADPANGMDSVDGVLLAQGITDPVTGAPTVGDDVVLDWTIANYLGDTSFADGRYGYPQFPDVLSFPVSETESVSDCDSSPQTRSVNQYGADYIRITCGAEATLRFEGSTSTGLLPASAYSGEYAFWSNKGDVSDMTLTRAFDFTGVSGDLNLSFQTWYDIETDWDYVYLLGSTNNGDDWEFITTPSGTDTNPTGNSYGWGFTGLSGGGNVSEWAQETVDISQFAGEQVLLRFEYVTDAAVNGEGFMIDDITIDEIGYSEDFEAGDGGWEALGFARVTNVLPQTFRLALINHDTETVDYIDIPDGNVVDVPLNGDDVTLVVIGTTRFTRQTAAYRFSFVP